MKNLALESANQLILKKHHLTDDTKIDNILQITDDLCGLHATGTIEPYLTLFARTNQFKKEDLDRINSQIGPLIKGKKVKLRSIEEIEMDILSVDKDLMSFAKPDAIFLHCIQAYYGYEVTKKVADGPK